MVVRTMCLIALLLAGGCGGSGTRTATPADARTAVAEVENTLTVFNRALAVGDSAELRPLVGSSFRLLDEGRVFEFDSLIASIRPTLAKGTMTREPTDFHTQVRDSTAWSDYRVTGRYQLADTGVVDSGRVLDLLEAAVLEKRDGRWTIVRMATLPARP